MSPYPRSLVLVAVLALMSHPAMAERISYDQERLLTPSTSSEDVILDFLKLGKITSPEFEEMIVRTDAYKSTPESGRNLYLQNELMRLNKKFLSLNPQRNGIMIRVGINVFFENMPDRRPALRIRFPSDGPNYFPYYYGGLPVALIVNGLDNFREIYLSEEEREQVSSVIGPTSGATLVLDLKPVTASATNPVVLDGQRQYPLLCDIAYIGVHNKETDQIWAWAPKAAPGETRKSPLAGLGMLKKDGQ